MASKDTVAWNLEVQSPAIKSRFESDPYDDCLMDDFGALAQHFGDGEEYDETHKSKKNAIYLVTLESLPAEPERVFFRGVPRSAFEVVRKN